MLIKYKERGADVSKDKGTCENYDVGVKKKPGKYDSEILLPITISIVVCLILLSDYLVSAFSEVPVYDNNINSGRVSVEEVALIRAYSTAWVINGVVRNMEANAVDGYINIKFLDANGDVTKTVLAYANDGDPIQAGQSAPFEYWANPSELSVVSDYKAMFVSW